MKNLRAFRPALLSFAVLGFLSFAPAAKAQIQISVSLSRSIYMVYEPIILTVSIHNLTGAPLLLQDDPRHRWFDVQVETVDGRPLPPRGTLPENPPATIAVGQTVKRSINLTPLFPITEFGGYRVRAVVYLPELGRYFESNQPGFEITEGRKLWDQTVGVPPDSGLDGKTRTYTLLAHRLPQSTRLYLRVADPERGVIYCTTQLGRFLSFGPPEVLVDSTNQIHILHNLAPKEYLYSHFDLNGKVQKQQAYQDFGSRPALVRTTDGGVNVLGGTPFDPKATPPERQLPGLGEHPVPIPGVGKNASPTPTPTPEDERPRSLLSR